MNWKNLFLTLSVCLIMGVPLMNAFPSRAVHSSGLGKNPSQYLDEVSQKNAGMDAPVPQTPEPDSEWCEFRAVWVDAGRPGGLLRTGHRRAAGDQAMLLRADPAFHWTPVGSSPVAGGDRPCLVVTADRTPVAAHLDL